MSAPSRSSRLLCYGYLYLEQQFPSRLAQSQLTVSHQMYSLRCPVLPTRKLTHSYTAWMDFPSGSELLVSGTVNIIELRERHCDVLSVAIKQRLQGGEK